MILPPDLLASDDGTITINTAPTIPGSIAIPETIQGGKAVTVSWTASSDAESNLEGYIVERSTDGGVTWTQVYQGGALSTANTVPFGSETVQYRVKAYDSDGAASGYRTSAARTVINNMAPSVPEDFSVPEQVQGGGTLAITWGAATDSDDNLSGYSLERQVDGGEWAEVYNGSALTFTDSITKGWEAVAYRLRAYDDLGVFGSYTAAQEREVNNNTPPEISCEAADSGEISAGFSVSYSVSDEEGDAITVEESVDGVLLRTIEDAAGEQALSLTGEAFLVLANGGHEVKITATDGRGVSSHALAFTKNVTAASVTLTESMTADAKISLCVLSVGGSIPDDADFAVEVTNNGLDEAPVWEDCTAQVKAGMNHVFENETAANGFAFNFRVAVERGESGVGGYITSIQGGFQ